MGTLSLVCCTLGLATTPENAFWTMCFELENGSLTSRQAQQEFAQSAVGIGEFHREFFVHNMFLLHWQALIAPPPAIL